MLRRLPWLTLLLAATTLLVAGSEPWTAAWEFNRAALAEGQLWRLLTGHFTHFNAEHLRWDVLTFILLGAVVEFRSRRQLVMGLASAGLAISVGIWWLQPQFANYRGLSGLDSALFALVACQLIVYAQRHHDRLLLALGLCAGAGFLAKTAYELIAGQPVFLPTSADFVPVPLAHLLGALAVGISGYVIRRPTARREATGAPKNIPIPVPTAPVSDTR